MPARERLLRIAAALVVFLLLGPAAQAQEQALRASKTEAPPPSELAPAVRALMTPAAVAVQNGSTILEFWWVTKLDASPPGQGWSAVPEGALVGAVRVSEPYRDIRGRRIKPGVYTLRYALQPMNGDHLGVSPHREFLLVCPASADTSAASAGYQGTVDLSKQTTGAAHPAVWSIDPPVSTAQPLNTYSNEAGHQGVVFQVQTSNGALTFGLILIGKIEA